MGILIAFLTRPRSSSSTPPILLILFRAPTPGPIPTIACTLTTLIAVIPPHPLLGILQVELLAIAEYHAIQSLQCFRSTVNAHKFNEARARVLAI